MRTSAVSEPLNFFIIVILIYDLLIFLLTLPLEKAALTTSRIYFMIYVLDITNIDKICY